MKRKTLLIALAALIVLPLGAFAQPPAGGGPRGLREGPNAPRRDRARTFLVLRIADALNLSDQDALKVSGVIKQSDERRQHLLEQRQALEEKLREALDKSPPDKTQLTALIREGNDIDQKLALIPEDSFRELQKILTTEQQAKLLLFRRELQGEIRRALQGRRAGGRRSLQGRSGPGPGALGGAPPNDQ